ncbi:MAG: acyl-CoA desaturase [Acidimicrobiales bacterium]
MIKHGLDRSHDERVNWVSSIPFFIVHLLPFLAFFTGVSMRAVFLGLVLFWVRLFFVTAGYHRYFSHRSYKLHRPTQFLLAFGTTTTAQKGPLWWAAHHRSHHRNSDTEDDVHSPQKGFWWSHVGWILSDKYKDTDYDGIKDFARFPELRFIDRHNWIGPWSLGVVSFLIAGWSGLLIGFFASTILLWHATFSINSLAHVMGRRRYATTDTSRNSLLLALLTWGEGWHNNHHFYQASARQGFFWWELDPTFYILKLGSWVGLVKDMKVPTKQIMAAGRVKHGSFDIGMFRAHWAKANAAVVASKAALSHSVGDHKVHLGDAVDVARESLDGVVQSTLHRAEELSKLSKQSTRLGLVD